MVAIIKLQTNDDEIFEIDVNLLRHSQLITSILDHYDDEEDYIIPFPLAKVNGDVFRKILEWGEHHIEDCILFDDDEPDDWDAQFIKVDHDMLTELMSAANYLAIDKLLDLLYETFSNIIAEIKPNEDINNRVEEAYGEVKKSQTSATDE